MQEFIIEFWDYLKISSPYLMIGLFASGFIHLFLSMNAITNLVKDRSFKSVFLASLFGVPLPLCSCSVIPAAVTLRKSGASNGSTSSFLISTPESGADSIMVTYSMMDLPMTILRPLVAFITAFSAGFLQNIFNDYSFQEEVAPKASCCHKKNQTQKPQSKIKQALSYGFGKLLNDISLWLLIGLVLGALINVVVPENFLENSNSIWGRFLILSIGIPFYVCASASTPIAASLLLKGMSPGTALLFLLVGPATNISNIAVLQKYIGKKGVLINIVTIAIISLLFSYLVDYMYSHFSWGYDFHIHDHEHEGSLFDRFSSVTAVLLLILLLKGVWVEEVKPRLFKK